MENVKEFLLNDIELLKEIVAEINSWDSSLDYLEVFENNEEFFEMFFANRPMDAVRAVCYGDYSYSDDYVHFNGYGNLESCSNWEFEDELKENIDEIIERLIELQHHIYISNNDLLELLENIENEVA